METSDYFFGLGLSICAIGLVIVGWIFALTDDVTVSANALLGVGTFGLMAGCFVMGALCAIWGYRR